MSDYLDVTISRDGTDYYRTVTLLQVPRVGDYVHIDDVYGKVRSVEWDINAKACGRSVYVRLERSTTPESVEVKETYDKR